MRVSDLTRDVARFTIVYHGPALAGRSSNLRWLHARLDPATRSAWTVGDGADGPTLSFDVTPTTLPRVARLTLVTGCGNLWSPATHATPHR